MKELLPSFQEEETDTDGHSNTSGGDSFPNGHMRVPSDAAKYAQPVSSPLFPDVEKLLSLFKDSCKELVELHKQVLFHLP